MYTAVWPAQRWQTFAVILSIPNCASRLMRHLRNRHRLQTLHESLRVNQVELGIGRLHAEEEFIAVDSGETIHVEQRVIRHGQTIQGKHPEDARKSSKQNRHLKRRNDKRRPGVIRL